MKAEAVSGKRARDEDEAEVAANGEQSQPKAKKAKTTRAKKEPKKEPKTKKEPKAIATRRSERLKKSKGRGFPVASMLRT